MPRQGLTRRDVLQACFRLIDEKGFEGFSMHELARRLNIRTASLYNHIENEATLLARIGQTATERFSRALADATEGKEGPEGIAALAGAWYGFATDHPGLYNVAMRAAFSGESGARPAFYCPADALTEGNAPAADLILATLHGFVSFENGGIFPPEEKKERTERLIEVLIELLERSAP